MEPIPQTQREQPHPDGASPPASPAAREQWSQPAPRPFTRADRATTTMLVFGLTANHDRFIAAAMRSLGYRVETLPPADSDSYGEGKAYCDRGMCNPAYFVVGHLLRHLRHLCDERGLSVAEIVARYLLVTPNGCGPCRFGLYINEYRKALREAGFEGFRVLLFNQALVQEQSGADAGLHMDARFLFHLVRAIMLADILNLLGYRARPYEVQPGATDAAMARSRAHLLAALERGRGVLAALGRVRREFAAVEVDRTRVRPKVAIIGEFWAMTTEGDGNYRLPSFLEDEGAEVEVQPITAWLLLLQWEAAYDARRLAGLPLPGRDAPAPAGPALWKKLLAVRAVVWTARGSFALFARRAGLHGYRLPDIDRLAAEADPYYDISQKGGESFMEVGKLIHYAHERSAHLVLSVKPFGCMPSSGVSDGVQALVSERHPQVQFLPVETTGDSAVNVYSRVQMQLFKVRQLAAREADEALRRGGVTLAEAQRLVAGTARYRRALHRSRQVDACTTANLFHEIARRPRFRLRRWWWALTGRRPVRDGEETPQHPVAPVRSRS